VINNNGGGALVLTGTFNVNVAGKTLTLGGNSTAGVNEIQGAIGNTASVTIAGTAGNIWQLSGPNTYTGQTTIGSNSTLNVTTLGDFGTASSVGYGTVGTSISFNSGNASTSTLNYVGSADSSGNRTIALNGGGPTTTGGATVQNNGTGNLTFTAGTFNVASATANVTRSLTLGGNNTGANVIQGAIVNNSANGKISLVKAGTGNWTLSGTNTYNGSTTVTAGTLVIAGSSTGNSTINVNAGTLDLGGGTANGSLASTVLNLGGGTFAYTRTGSTTQNFTTKNVIASGSAITVVSGDILNLGNLTHTTGSTIDFVNSPGKIATATANTNGIIGDWATFNNGTT